MVRPHHHSISPNFIETGKSTVSGFSKNYAGTSKELRSDCGVFSIACATCIVYGLNPGIAKFYVPQTRPHLSQCLKAGVISPFPEK